MEETTKKPSKFMREDIPVIDFDNLELTSITVSNNITLEEAIQLKIAEVYNCFKLEKEHGINPDIVESIKDEILKMRNVVIYLRIDCCKVESCINPDAFSGSTNPIPFLCVGFSDYENITRTMGKKVIRNKGYFVLIPLVPLRDRLETYYLPYKYARNKWSMVDQIWSMGDINSNVRFFNSVAIMDLNEGKAEYKLGTKIIQTAGPLQNFEPYVSKLCPYIPLLSLAEIFGFEYKWKRFRKIATLTKGDNIITVFYKTKKIEYNSSSEYFVKNEVMYIDKKSKLLYVPLSIVNDLWGAEYTWDVVKGEAKIFLPF